jgi:hypothetical protein
MLAVEPLEGYRVRSERGGVPVFHPPYLAELGGSVSRILERGAHHLSGLLGMEPPGVEALLVPEEDWRGTPRDGERPYPYGLPYFTRSTHPPTLVLPPELDPVFGPRTEVLFPLTVWHELAHAFLLRREVVRTPPWLGELLPQAAAAAVARKEGLPLDGHLSLVDRQRGFTVRTFGGRASAEDQMRFQNLLLVLGDAAVREFGAGFLRRLLRMLWDERDVVDEGRAEEMLAGALGSGGRTWLLERAEF